MAGNRGTGGSARRARGALGPASARSAKRSGAAPEKPTNALDSDAAALLREQLRAERAQRSRASKIPPPPDGVTPHEPEQAADGDDSKPPRLDRGQIGRLKRQLYDARKAGEEAREQRGDSSGLDYGAITLADNAAMRAAQRAALDAKARAATTPESTAPTTPDPCPGLG